MLRMRLPESPRPLIVRLSPVRPDRVEGPAMQQTTGAVLVILMTLVGCQSAPKSEKRTEAVDGTMSLRGRGEIERVEVLRLLPGDDVRASLDRWAKEGQIQAASILSAVGSLTVASIRFSDEKEASILKGPFEIVALSGVISNDGSHTHIAVSDRVGKTLGGHLGVGSTVHTTLELVLGVYKDMRFIRSDDPRSGYKELFISPAEKKVL